MRAVHSRKVNELQNEVSYKRRKYKKRVEQQVAQEPVKGHKSEKIHLGIWYITS